MMRPVTIFTMLMAALSGAYLFEVKHRAQVLDDQIAAYSQSSRLDAMRIRVLQGQWSLETDPTRLQQLAAQFTALQPMQPAQLVTMAGLRDSLPPPGSAAPGSNPVLPESAPQMAVAAVTQQSAPGGLPLPPPEPPLRLAGLAPASAASLRPVQRIAHRTSHSALHLANTELAEALPPAKPFYAPRPIREIDRQMLASTGQTVPMGAQVMSVKATAPSQYVSPDGGSALGIASNLPPAQPMAANGSDN